MLELDASFHVKCMTHPSIAFYMQFVVIQAENSVEPLNIPKTSDIASKGKKEKENSRPAGK
ncbi:hypothetical protein BLOT_016705 [Blomia tropicalis]|nr:hypothetical protein BLOT_016705 [Blomia tropicalis]